MKTAWKYLTIAGLAIAALTWPLFKVSSTQEKKAARDKDEFKTSEVDATAEERARDFEEGVAGREAYRRLQLQDENGQIPRDGWRNAYQKQAEMPFLPEAWREFLPSGSEIPNPWVSIGPGNIGGRIRSMVIHPNPHPEIMWVGGTGGGVWKTTDKGESWSTTTDQMANLAVTCLAIDPTNPDILYAGTGEAIPGDGIFKTTDGGAHWMHLSSTAGFASMNRLVICPTNPQILLAANTAGIFRSTDGGGTWSPPAGILPGDWSDVRFRPATGSAKPAIPDVQAINCLAGSRDGRIYYSGDNGANWATNAQNGLPAPGGDHRIDLAYSRNTPTIVYASVAGTQITSELFRSENGGFSFTSLGHPSVPANLPGANGFTSALWVDPINPDTVVVGGVYLLRTMDRGVHWEECDANSHADTHVLVEHPGYNRGIGRPGNAILYSGSDGGLYQTSNILAVITPTPSGGSVVWSSKNHSLGVTQFYGAAGNAATGVILGGTQDNGTVRYFGDPENWGYMRLGDGGFCAADQVAESQQPYYFGEGYYLSIHRSKTATGPADDIYGGVGHPYGIPGCVPSNLPCANFTAPFILDPNDRTRILAGGASLWRTDDARLDNALLIKWTEIKPVSGAGNINAVAIAQGNSNFVWVGYNDGTVYYTLNGLAGPWPSPLPTPTWTTGDPNNVLPHGYGHPCTRITIAPPSQMNDPQVATKVYVTFGGFNNNNVWRRENDGVTWTPIHHNLPPTPVYSLVVSPINPDILYIGTEIGVFASSNGGTSWSPDYGTPARTRVYELFWMGPKLVAATHGRGIFTLTPPSN